MLFRKIYFKPRNQLEKGTKQHTLLLSKTNKKIQSHVNIECILLSHSTNISTICFTLFSNLNGALQNQCIILKLECQRLICQNKIPEGEAGLQ